MSSFCLILKVQSGKLKKTRINDHLRVLKQSRRKPFYGGDGGGDGGDGVGRGS